MQVDLLHTQKKKDVKTKRFHMSCEVLLDCSLPFQVFFPQFPTGPPSLNHTYLLSVLPIHFVPVSLGLPFHQFPFLNTSFSPLAKSSSYFIFLAHVLLGVKICLGLLPVLITHRNLSVFFFSYTLSFLNIRHKLQILVNNIVYPKIYIKPI